MKPGNLQSSVLRCQASRSLSGCHSERSEESPSKGREILRCAQNDNHGGVVPECRQGRGRRQASPPCHHPYGM